MEKDVKEIQSVIDGLNDVEYCAERCEDLASSISAFFRKGDMPLGYQDIGKLMIRIAMLRRAIKDTADEVVKLQKTNK